jgi:hypothetical protein
MGLNVTKIWKGSPSTGGRVVTWIDHPNIVAFPWTIGESYVLFASYDQEGALVSKPGCTVARIRSDEAEKTTQQLDEVADTKQL